MVIMIVIINWDVRKVLIDEGSSCDILFWSTFQRLDVSHMLVKPYLEPLIGFIGGQVHTHGVVDLATTFVRGELSRTLLV